LFVSATTVNATACAVERAFPVPLVPSNVEIDAAYEPAASDSCSVQVVLASELVHPLDVGVRPTVIGKPAGFAVPPVPVTLTVIDCVAGDTYAGRCAIVDALCFGTTIVKVTVVFAGGVAT
jgi:hypothetical protein